eukprot:TRINITY_DN27147_c0_g1_i1.p1 TRINITY_DN27147_c0_g1~~TRINITY_DN27147_c0_g1_i1.p1  ORF type:complete len:646 (+),score=118.97 TRINITY_DN27147_c0_g1_i1:34-1938(+)
MPAPKTSTCQVLHHAPLKSQQVISSHGQDQRQNLALFEELRCLHTELQKHDQQVVGILQALQERLDRVVVQVETRKEPAPLDPPVAEVTATTRATAENNNSGCKKHCEKQNLEDWKTVHDDAELDEDGLDTVHVFSLNNFTDVVESTEHIEGKGELKARAAWQEQPGPAVTENLVSPTPMVLHRRQGQTVKAVEQCAKVGKRTSNFLTADKRSKAKESLTRLQHFVTSSIFEAFSGVLIVTNIMYVAVECEFRAERYEWYVEKNQEIDEKEGNFIEVEGLFLVLFAVELGFRMAAEGRAFFDWRGKDFTWNVLDTLIVLLDLIVFIFEVFVTASSVSSFSLMRVLRVLRVARVSKVIRVMKLFTELRILMYSIFSCIRSMLWVLVVLILALLLFSILFTSATTSLLHTLELRKMEENENLRMHFGTVLRSTLSLYQSMTGGNDWDVFYCSLKPLDGVYRLIYLVYITFVLFALANVITGVFVENAKASGKKDREIVIQEEMAVKRRYVNDMRTIFEEMDFDSTGRITWEEFQSTLEDPRVVAYFSALKLDVTDIRHLFRLLDADNSGEIGYTEFVEGCWSLQGVATSLDTKILRLEVESLRRSVMKDFSALSGTCGEMYSWPMAKCQTYDDDVA